MAKTYKVKNVSAGNIRINLDKEYKQKIVIRAGGLEWVEVPQAYRDLQFYKDLVEKGDLVEVEVEDMATIKKATARKAVK